MSALRFLVVPAVVSLCCASARADLTIVSIGDIFLGNSWSVPVTLGGSGFDMLVVEATGATFEAPVGITLSNPSGWTTAQSSATVVSAMGSTANTSGFDLILTFNDPQASTASVVFSGFLPGFDNAASSVEMSLNAAGTAFEFSGLATTNQTRSGVSSAHAPVPGAVALGLVGFGLVGLARKRLR